MRPFLSKPQTVEPRHTGSSSRICFIDLRAIAYPFFANEHSWTELCHQGLRTMTPHQAELLSRLHAIRDRHDLQRCAQIEVLGGPRVFDARCYDAGRTIWHWAGTADQI